MEVCSYDDLRSSTLISSYTTTSFCLHAKSSTARARMHISSNFRSSINTVSVKGFVCAVLCACVLKGVCVCVCVTFSRLLVNGAQNLASQGLLRR